MGYSSVAYSYHDNIDYCVRSYIGHTILYVQSVTQVTGMDS